MPAKWLYPAEWWPVLTIDGVYDRGEPYAMFTDEEIADLRRLQAEFRAWQQKIAERFGKPDYESSGDFTLTD